MSKFEGLDSGRQSTVRLKLASPDDILDWSFGEVAKGETVNYRTGKPEDGGLFCQRIFGPQFSWRCKCGKYRGSKYDGIKCDRCSVEVVHSNVRRERMGHIELAAPVAHIWFFKMRPNRLAALVDRKSSEIESLVYFQSFLVVKSDDASGVEVGWLLAEDELREVRQSGAGSFEVQSGAEAVETLLKALDLHELSTSLRAELAQLDRKPKPSKQKKERLVKRLVVVESLLHSGNRPEWMILQRLPVIPPDLRPLVALPSGGYVTSDLNELYRRVINRNLRLKRLLGLTAPQIIIRNEKRLLQLAVDALFDNGRCHRPVLGSVNRPLRSLADMLAGKQGRFRENLLGKRVDYSGRSVIVVGPELALHQCGLPKRIALELYQTFVVRQLLDRELAKSVKAARGIIQRREVVVWSALEEAMKDRPVLLNRAPTLHRMNIQAFEPLLIEGNAIRLHPLACKAFNADFDGDQMAVHLPLSVEAQIEAKVLMMAPHNVFSPANGKPILGPSQDMVLGCHYLTDAARANSVGGPALRGAGLVFSCAAEAISAYEQRQVDLLAPVQLRLPLGQTVYESGSDALERNGSENDAEDQRVDELAPEMKLIHGARTLRVATTMGRVLFNDLLPEGMAYYNVTLDAKRLSRIVADCSAKKGRIETIALLDRLKGFSVRAATRSGLSFAASDLQTPSSKPRILEDAARAAAKLERHYDRGVVSHEDRRERLYEIWTTASDKIASDLLQTLADDRGKNGAQPNPVYLMARSGARGGWEQVRQLAGMRGLMSRPSGEIVETPIRSSFREGLSVAEYFLSTHGARKGLADTALKTANAGYLTRKLADVAQDVVVTMEDCGCVQGVWKPVHRDHGALDRPIRGRVNLAAVRTGGGAIVKENELIDDEQASRMERSQVDKIRVRSPLTCEAPHGVCRQCYGEDLSRGELVEIGTAVGVIAAQSIGEPGTQLTMRTFYTGGAVGATDDITSGLPRVIELFEARASGPKDQKPAVLARVAGLVEIPNRPVVRGKRTVIVNAAGGDRDHEHLIPASGKLTVTEGDFVQPGDALTEGPVSYHDLLDVCGSETVYQSLLNNIQQVYRMQHVEVDDKHFEIILSCMLRREMVESPGDTDLLPGVTVHKNEIRAANEKLKRVVKIDDPGDSRFAAGAIVGQDAYQWEHERLQSATGKRPPTSVRPQQAISRPQLMGVTKAALEAESFLSAASFQQTAQALADAALAGKKDQLRGLKENVIVGALAPCGGGFHAREQEEQCDCNRTLRAGV